MVVGDCGCDVWSGGGVWYLFVCFGGFLVDCVDCVGGDCWLCDFGVMCV